MIAHLDPAARAVADRELVGHQVEALGMRPLHDLARLLGLTPDAFTTRVEAARSRDG